MHNFSVRAFGIVLLAGLTSSAAAQDETPPDTLRSYDLNEIVVSDGVENREEILTVQRIRIADLAKTNAATADRMMRLIPSAHVQTNSRGESLVYLRNAGERQVAVFLDGALLNVPWDNRVDLSLVPSSMIGSVSVSKGASSVLYGTNVLGGAVNLISKQSSAATSEISAELSDPQSLQVQLNQLGTIKKINYALSGGYLQTDGQALSNEADLPFGQLEGETRTNTNRKLLNLFGRVSIPIGSSATGSLTAIHYSGEKGIAPEGHLDPSETRVRYWQLPNLQNTMFIGNYALTRSTGSVRATAWASSFEQTINQFDRFDYADLADVQEDHDKTIGLRVVSSKDVGKGNLKVSFNGLSSSHEQVDLEVDGQNVTSVIQDYRQNIFSLGSEYGRSVSVRSAITFGASIDGYSTPKTGDKPARDPDFTYSLLAGGKHILSDDFQLRFAAGRKVRFPTPRELFGESLGRFLVNPDLNPETSYLAEVGIGLSSSSISGEIIPFVSRTYDTIDRRNVELDSTVFRQRINLKGSRVFGVEAVGAAQPSRYVSVRANATWTNSRALNDGDSNDRLVEKPALLADLNVELRALRSIQLLLTSTYTGKAFSLGEDNSFIELPTSLVLGTRVSYLRTIKRIQGGIEAYIRIDNLTDELVLPQLGLPGAGRSAAIGVSITI